MPQRRSARCAGNIFFLSCLIVAREWKKHTRDEERQSDTKVPAPQLGCRRLAYELDATRKVLRSAAEDLTRRRVVGTTT